MKTNFTDDHLQEETQYKVIKEGQYEYIETDPGNDHVFILLHGLFGAMSNFKCILAAFGHRVNIVIPLLPFFKLPLKEVNVIGLTEYIKTFIDYKNFQSFHFLGNSVGGHIALLYTIKYPEQVQSLSLTGSSGLYESSFGSTFPRRGDYQYIHDMSVQVFHNTSLATKKMVDEVYEIVNDPKRAICVLYIARSAIKYNLSDQIEGIKCPVLLIWGKNDTITPPFVAERFHSLLDNSHLHWIEACGHAPMMEKPDEFLEILSNFFSSNLGIKGMDRFKSNFSL